MRNIIITGASRGIGKELAYVLAKEGYGLFILSSKSEKELFKVRDDINNMYGSVCEAALCDVGSFEDVNNIIGSYVNKNGVYAIVNNAAISAVKLITDMSYDEWKRLMEVNLNSCFYTSKVVLPYMIGKKEGRIINVSSVWGSVGASMEVAYSASKGGVNAFTKALAKELAPSNIKVNAASFGIIDTEMNAHLNKEEIASIVSDIPMDRLGSTGEAALMLLNILRAPDYMTGQIITMDGGWI